MTMSLPEILLKNSDYDDMWEFGDRARLVPKKNATPEVIEEINKFNALQDKYDPYIPPDDDTLERYRKRFGDKSLIEVLKRPTLAKETTMIMRHCLETDTPYEEMTDWEPW